MADLDNGSESNEQVMETTEHIIVSSEEENTVLHIDLNDDDIETLNDSIEEEIKKTEDTEKTEITEKEITLKVNADVHQFQSESPVIEVKSIDRDSPIIDLDLQSNFTNPIYEDKSRLIVKCDEDKIENIEEIRPNTDRKGSLLDRLAKASMNNDNTFNLELANRNINNPLDRMLRDDDSPASDNETSSLLDRINKIANENTSGQAEKKLRPIDKLALKAREDVTQGDSKHPLDKIVRNEEPCSRIVEKVTKSVTSQEPDRVPYFSKKPIDKLALEAAVDYKAVSLESRTPANKALKASLTQDTVAAGSKAPVDRLVNSLTGGSEEDQINKGSPLARLTQTLTSKDID